MLYIISLEPIETRYTKQWQKWFNDDFPESIEISGNTLSEISNSKNFLDPFQTNIWKSEQIIKLSYLFKDNKIKKGDKFLFLDAWHYGVIALKYMSALSSIPIKIYGLWHAGSYDDFDLLGSSGLFPFFNNFEESLFKCIDMSFVATQFHKYLILSKYPDISNIKVTGFPYKFNELPVYNNSKENLILFPHRLSEEKQPYILKDLEADLNRYDIQCVFCQETKLTKDQYYTLLSKAKMVFSASLQETWGIGAFEGLHYKAYPYIPNRLSYTEMYHDFFKYPSNWSDNFDNYFKNKNNLIIDIVNKIHKYDEIDNEIYLQNIKLLEEKYCTLKNIKDEIGE